MENLHNATFHATLLWGEGDLSLISSLATNNSNSLVAINCSTSLETQQGLDHIIPLYVPAASAFLQSTLLELGQLVTGAVRVQ